MSQPRQLAVPAYVIAFTLVFLPLVDGLMAVLPVRIHDARWRFGTFGIMANNAMLLPTAGILVALVTAVMLDHRRFQRIAGVLSFVGAFAILGLLGVFGLDALQVRGDVKPPAQFAFTVAAVSATMKSILAMISLFALGFAGFRGPKPSKSGKSSPPSSGLIMGGSRSGGGSKTPRDTPSASATT